jgi:hypothetical protein
MMEWCSATAVQPFWSLATFHVKRRADIAAEREIVDLTNAFFSVPGSYR